MAALWTLALVLFAGTVCAANRIVGGEPTTIENYPSIVQLDYLVTSPSVWGRLCGASIINNFYIVTAAHCLDGPYYSGPQSRRIRSGTTNYGVGGVISYVASVLNHPNYDTSDVSYNDGDLGLCRVTTSFTYNNFTQPIVIPTEGFELPDGLDVVIAGWGMIREDGPLSNVLRDVTVQSINREICMERYSNFTGYAVTENMMCTGILDVGGKDSCQGDSGGPVYYGNFLIGVVSYGQGCALPYYPGINTKVSSYTSWILNNTTT